MKNGIAVLDFGSQLTQLIARRLRELNIYSELFRYDVSVEELRAFSPKGIILSGGPSSVYDSDAPIRDVKELIEIAPVLGICYGMQLLSQQLGGKVTPAETREYGFANAQWTVPMGRTPMRQRVWMSHGDIVEQVPPGFEVVARSGNDHPAAMKSDRVWAVQFHPEVSHTEDGMEVLRAFVFELCQAQVNWTSKNIALELESEVLAKVGDEHVLCALSGGVDSTVVGTLLTKALGHDRVHCVFVNNGLLRENEFEKVLQRYQELGLNVQGIDASQEFLDQLSGVADPEQKRKIIGRVFIEVFEKKVADLDKVQWLAQGTLYPDVIESISPRGHSVTIKSHHNVGGLPEKMKLKLVEPLRELFKDEVRKLGAELGIPEEMLWRHPFPGPGLAIRVMGAVSSASLDILREADAIYIDELRKNNLYSVIWQAFCVLLPVKTVGVQGDARTYENVLALRAVTSSDGMTADWYPFSFEFLRHVSNRITNEVRGVNRVVYDVTSKPPGTIEWE